MFEGSSNHEQIDQTSISSCKSLLQLVSSLPEGPTSGSPFTEIVSAAANYAGFSVCLKIRPFLPKAIKITRRRYQRNFAAGTLPSNCLRLPSKLLRNDGFQLGKSTSSHRKDAKRGEVEKSPQTPEDPVASAHKAVGGSSFCWG